MPNRDPSQGDPPRPGPGAPAEPGTSHGPEAPPEPGAFRRGAPLEPGPLPGPGAHGRRGGWLLAVVFLLFWAALQYPGWRVANRVEPFVLGLPFMLAWALAWWAVVVGTMVYVAARAGRDGSG